MGRCAARLRRLWLAEGSRHVFQKALAAADSTVAILFAAASIASVSATVIVAFIAARVALAADVPFLAAWEQYITVWACWVALYTGAARGRKARSTTVILGLLVAILFGEVIREGYFSNASLKGLPRNQAFQLVYTGVNLKSPSARQASRTDDTIG